MCNQVSHIYQPTFKEMEEPMKYFCECCKHPFDNGVRYSKDNRLRFCDTCVRDKSVDVFLIEEGLTLCQIYNVTMNECEILK